MADKRKKKNTFEIFVPKDDNLYRFYHDLEKYRNSYIEFNDCKDRNGIARSLGKKMKPLKGYVVPPLSRRHGDSITGIMLRRDVKVKGKKKGNGKIFSFLRY